MAEGATVMDIALAVAITVLLGAIMTTAFGIAFDLNGLSFWGMIATCIAAVGCGVILVAGLWIVVLR